MRQALRLSAACRARLYATRPWLPSGHALPQLPFFWLGFAQASPASKRIFKLEFIDGPDLQPLEPDGSKLTGKPGKDAF